MAVPLVIGAALGNPAAGAAGALPALSVSYSDSRDPYPARARRMLLATALVSGAVTVGALSGVSTPAAVAASTLCAFGAGLMVLFGLQTGNLGVTTLAALVVFAARHLTPLQSLEAGLIAFGCGLLQTLLAVAFWPVNRYEPERKIIASLYAALADLSVSPLGRDSAPPATAQLAETQKVLTSLSQDRSRQAERYFFLINQAERMRLSLLTLRRLMHRIGRDGGGEEAAATIEHALAAASRALAQASHAILDGSEIDLTSFLEAVHRFHQLMHPANSPFLAAVDRDAAHQLDALAGQFRAIRNLVSASGAAPKPLPQPIADQPNSIPAMIRANLSFRSTAFRHALRLAICVGLAEALGRFLSLQRTYWLTITIAIVLRPDYTSTFTRGILRVAGTLAGLGLATVLLHFLHPGTTTDIVLIVIFAFLLRWIGPANYGVFVTALSGYVVLLLAVVGVSPREAVLARAVNTILGGAIALAAYRLWPTWERTRAGPVLADLMDAYREYFRCVMDAYITGRSDEARRDRARSKARLARSNAEALINRVAGEPGMTAARANLLSGILSSAHNFVRAVMSLESGLNLQRHERVRPATVEFAAQVDDTFGKLSAALRSSRAPAQLPDLREFHNAILASSSTDSAQYTLVNTETDRITTTVSTLTDQTEKWLHASGL